MKDFLLNSGLTVLIGIVCSILVSFLKKGMFEGWGIVVGKFLSKIGCAQIGKSNWEKVEDVLTVSVLSFAQGIKKGADWDDNEVQNLLTTGTRQPAAENKRIDNSDLNELLEKATKKAAENETH